MQRVFFASRFHARLETSGLKSWKAANLISLAWWKKNVPGATVLARLPQLYCTQHFQYIKYTQIQGLAAQSRRLCHSTLCLWWCDAAAVYRFLIIFTRYGSHTHINIRQKQHAPSTNTYTHIWAAAGKWRRFCISAREQPEMRQRRRRLCAAPAATAEFQLLLCLLARWIH